MLLRERFWSWAAITASRIGWTKLGSHWLPNPAPPAPTPLVIQSLLWRSSAMVSRPGRERATVSLIA